MERHTQQELAERLAAKQLDQALTTQLQHEFNCSPFESRAIVNVVKATYLGPLRNPETVKPGQLVVLAIRATEPAGKPLKACQFVPIVVTVHDPADDELRQAADRQAIARVRQAQIVRMAWEAVAQDSYQGFLQTE